MSSKEGATCHCPGCDWHRLVLRLSRGHANRYQLWECIKKPMLFYALQLGTIRSHRTAHDLSRRAIDMLRSVAGRFEETRRRGAHGPRPSGYWWKLQHLPAGDTLVGEADPW